MTKDWDAQGIGTGAEILSESGFTAFDGAATNCVFLDVTLL